MSTIGPTCLCTFCLTPSKSEDICLGLHFVLPSPFGFTIQRLYSPLCVNRVWDTKILTTTVLRLNHNNRYSGGVKGCEVEGAKINTLTPCTISTY